MVEQWYNSRTASKSPSRSSLRRSRFKLLLSQYWWRLWSASWRNLQDQLPKLLFHLDTVLRFTQGSGQFIFCMTISLRASSPGRSRGGTGKRKESLQLRLWNLNMCIEKADAKGWLVEMTLIMTSLPLACIFQFLFTFALVSASRWLVEIWQLSRRGATGELEVEFKFRRRSCKLSFLPRPWWCRRRDLNLGPDVGGKRVFSPLRHPWSSPTWEYFCPFISLLF